MYAFGRTGSDCFINAFLGASLRHDNKSLFGFLVKSEHFGAKSNAALATDTFFRFNENFLAHYFPHPTQHQPVFKNYWIPTVLYDAPPGQKDKTLWSHNPI